MVKENGGARQGAGRKRKAIKNETAISRAEQQIKDRLPDVVERQLELAMGGIEQIEQKWVPAGTVMALVGGIPRLVYPDKPVDELVLVERKISHTLPDRAAGQYLMNRIMGTPTQKNEITGANGGPIEVNDTTPILDKIYKRLSAGKD